MHKLLWLTILVTSSNSDRKVHASLISTHWCGKKTSCASHCAMLTQVFINGPGEIPAEFQGAEYWLRISF